MRMEMEMAPGKHLKPTDIKVSAAMRRIPTLIAPHVLHESFVTFTALCWCATRIRLFEANARLPVSHPLRASLRKVQLHSQLLTYDNYTTPRYPQPHLRQVRRAPE